jgi:hypothetical protein
MEPPVPPAAFPVAKYKAPEPPKLVDPVLKAIRPLIPDIPPVAVVK